MGKTYFKKYEHSDQLYLSPCEEGNPHQSWEVVYGMLRLRTEWPHKICVVWDMKGSYYSGKSTRVWSAPCSENNVFAGAKGYSLDY